MNITLSPIRTDELLTVTRAGDVLSINGQAFDFGPLPDGATLPVEAIDSPWFAGAVSRVNGVLHLTLRLPHGANPSPAVAFPEPVTVTADGPVPLPFDPPPPDEAEEALP